MALKATMVLGADSKSSTKCFTSTCFTAKKGDQHAKECFGHVKWAMEHGINEHPEWYPGLTSSSSFEEFQLSMHKSGHGFGTCPKPCSASEEKNEKETDDADGEEKLCRTAAEGEACHGHVEWAMAVGIRTSPQWYPGLSAASTFHDFQASMSATGQGFGTCPQPCDPDAIASSDPSTLAPSPSATEEDGCHTAVENEACYGNVRWAMEVGIVLFPQWYLGLTPSSAFENFQASMHASGHGHGTCPRPCDTVTTPPPTTKPSPAAGCHTATQAEECFGHVVWAMEYGIYTYPEWYPGLSSWSTFVEFQASMHASGHAYGTCPQPCPEEKPSATLFCLVWGDPHYVTFSGNKFDFQGVGTYELLSSEADGLVMHGFNCPATARASASFLTGIAMRIGSHTVSVIGNTFKINGSSAPYPSNEVSIDGITFTSEANGNVAIVLPSGAKIHIKDHAFEDDSISLGFAINVVAVLPSEHIDDATGLCKSAQFNDKVTDSWFSEAEIDMLRDKCSLPDTDDTPAECHTPEEACEKVEPAINFSKAETACASLKEKTAEVYEGCLFDYCASGGDDSVVDVAEEAEILIEEFSPTPSPFGPMLVCTSFGDPHFSMFSGGKHNFQGIGEFVLAASKDGGFKVSACQQQWGGALPKQRTVNTMFAVRVSECTVLCAKGMACTKNGMCDGVDVTENGAAFSTGEKVYRSSLRSGSVAVKVPSTTYANNLEGLCGAYSPLAFSNAFTNSCGDVTPGFNGGPAAGAKYKEFVRTFANTWRVDTEDSLFAGAGSDYACAPDPEATPQEENPPFDGCPEELRAKAEKACAAAGMNAQDCIDDAGATCEVDEWVQEAVDANVAASSADVEKPNCTFLVTGRPKRYGNPKSFDWSGRCDTTFSVVSGPVAEEVPFASKQNWCIRYFSIGAEFLVTSSGVTLGYLSCSNQDFWIESKSTVISTIGALATTPTASPTPASESAICKELAASTNNRKLQAVDQISSPSPLSMAQITLALPVTISGDASELHLDKTYMALIHTLGQKLLDLIEDEAAGLAVTPETASRLESGRTRVVYAFVATVPTERASSIVLPTEVAINVLFTSALVLAPPSNQYDIVPASGGVVESTLMISDAPQLLVATVTFFLPTAAPTTATPTTATPTATPTTATPTTLESESTESPAESTTQSSATSSTTEGTTEGAEGMANTTTSTNTEDAPVSKGHASFVCTAVTLLYMYAVIQL